MHIYSVAILMPTQKCVILVVCFCHRFKSRANGIAEGKFAAIINEETARSPAIAARSPTILVRKQIAGLISCSDSAAIAVFSPAI